MSKNTKISVFETSGSVEDFLINSFNISKSKIKQANIPKKFLKSEIKDKQEISIPLNLINQGIINPIYTGIKLKVLHVDKHFTVLEKFCRTHTHPLSYEDTNNCLSFLRQENLGNLKIKKDQLPDQLKLIPNPDILLELGKLKSSQQTLVGFAAESDDHLDNARKKLEGKNLDWIVVNDISNRTIGFESEKNEVTLLSRKNETFTLPLSTKREIASGILQRIWK